jgi:hypothetical protein
VKVGDLVRHRFEGGPNDLGLVVYIDNHNPMIHIARVVWPGNFGVERAHRVRRLETVSVSESR